MEQTLPIKRFKEIREENHFTQVEFAEKIGIRHSTADIERGRTKLSGEVIKELLKQFNINPLWIFGESTQKFLNLNQVNLMPKVITMNSEEHENMLLVNQRAAAGYPQNIYETDWHRRLPAFNLPLPQYRNASYRGFQVEGDSMVPNLKPEEWVLAKAVEGITTITEGKIYVIVTYDSVLVKKLHKLPDPSKIRLVSINSDYAPLELEVTEVQELWEVTSKLTFSLDGNSENHILKELQESMIELKAQLKAVNQSQTIRD